MFCKQCLKDLQNFEDEDLLSSSILSESDDNNEDVFSERESANNDGDDMFDISHV